jgi:hypothetical protein
MPSSFLSPKIYFFRAARLAPARAAFFPGAAPGALPADGLRKTVSTSIFTGSISTGANSISASARLPFAEV